MDIKDLQLDKIKKPKVKPLFRRLSLLHHTNIPKPLHGLNPRTIMGKEWWDEKRKEAYNKNNRCCHACGAHSTSHPLEAHEVYELIPSQGKAIFIEVVALCSECHKTIHLGFTEIKYGLKVVKRLMERKWDLIEKEEGIPDASWKKWGLIFEGKFYKGKFKNYEEWESYYREKGI